MRPMRTGTPSAALARVSMDPRQSSMWGKIPQCSVSHASSSRLHKASTSTIATRKAAQDHDSTTRRRRGSAGSEAEGINGMKSAFGARRPGLDESWLATRQPGFGKALAI